MKIMKIKFSKNDILSIFVFLVLLVLVVLAICCRTPKTDWITNTILAFTALVFLWYTRETAAMKAEVVKQNRLRNKNAGRVIEPRKMYSCGQWIAMEKSVVKADGVQRLEGSRPGCVMASVQVTTGV